MPEKRTRKVKGFRKERVLGVLGVRAVETEPAPRA